jgi:hypothetical protein
MDVSCSRIAMTGRHRLWMYFCSQARILFSVLQNRLGHAQTEIMAFLESTSGETNVQVLPIEKCLLARKQSRESRVRGSRNGGVRRCSGSRARHRGLIACQPRGVHTDICIVHGQMHNGQCTRADRRASLLVLSIRVADAVGFESNVVPIQDRVHNFFLCVLDGHKTAFPSGSEARFNSRSFAVNSVAASV